MLSLKQWVLGASLLIFILMGVGLYWQHSTISSQALTIDSQAKQLAYFEKDKKAQDKADKQLKAAKEKIAKERQEWKDRLNEALNGNKCADVPFDDNTQRMLNELYGKGS